MAAASLSQMPPDDPPIGLQLARAARRVGRAFDDALAQAGGSTPVWLVLLNLKIHPAANQRALAAAVGVREATLTHHLNAMEKDGLLTRRRDHNNRRVHVVKLTKAGEAAFAKLARAAVDFDRRLRHGLNDEQLGQLTRLLQKLVANIDDERDPSMPWAGLIEQKT